MEARDEAVRDPSVLRELVLELAAGRRTLVRGIVDVMKQQNLLLYPFAKQQGVSGTTLSRFVGEGVVASPEFIQKIARIVGQEALGKRMIEALAQCGASSTLRLMVLDDDAIRLAFDLFQAYRDIQPPPLLKDFSSLFSPHEEIVEDVLYVRYQGIKSFSEPAVKERVFEVLVSGDLSSLLSRKTSLSRKVKMVSSAQKNKKNLKGDLRMLVGRLRPYFVNQEEIGEAAGIPRTTIRNALSKGYYGIERLQDILEKLQALLAQKEAQNESVPAQVNPPISPQRDPERDPPPSGVQAFVPVVTSKTFAYIDEVPNQAELDYMQLKIEETRVMIERLARMQNDEARQRVQKMLSGSTANLHRALRLFGYTYPKDFIHIFEAEKGMNEILGSTSLQPSGKKKGK